LKKDYFTKVTSSLPFIKGKRGAQVPEKKPGRLEIDQIPTTFGRARNPLGGEGRKGKTLFAPSYTAADVRTVSNLSFLKAAIPLSERVEVTRPPSSAGKAEDAAVARR